MDNKATKITRYINSITGECHDRVSYVSMQFDNDGYLFWAKKNNIKTYLDEPLPPCFTWSERGRIDAIKHYILRDNQLLVYTSGNVIKPMTSKEMARLLDMSDRQCKAFVKKLKINGIIKEICFDNLRYFAFNPRYGFKGKRMSLNVYIFFQNELQDVLPDWVKRKFLEQAQELKPDIHIIK